jgi:hypothetical protein
MPSAQAYEFIVSVTSGAVDDIAAIAGHITRASESREPKSQSDRSARCR